jgi:hypothetical protein
MTGNGRMTQLLEQLVLGQQALIEGQAGTNARLDQTNAKLDQTNAKIDQTNERLDRALHMLGGHHADHERRITALEEHILKTKS